MPKGIFISWTTVNFISKKFEYQKCKNRYHSSINEIFAEIRMCTF